VSNTHIHKEKGYFNNDIEGKKTDKYLNQCKRFNREKSFFYQWKKHIIDKDDKRDIDLQLDEYYALMES